MSDYLGLVKNNKLTFKGCFLVFVLALILFFSLIWFFIRFKVVPLFL